MQTKFDEAIFPETKSVSEELEAVEELLKGIKNEYEKPDEQTKKLLTE